jgi:apolipoprotein D and lipocalin family protein
MAFLAVSVCTAALATDPAPLATVKALDARRYLGTWNEIAMYPNFFQRKCARDTSAEYSAGEGAEIVVQNRCVNAEGGVEMVTGVARRADPADPTRLKVRFAPSWLAWLPLVWGDYWVIGLADDYRYAVVGEPRRDYLWILARATRLSREDRATIDGLLRAAGYDPARLVETQHTR